MVHILEQAKITMVDDDDQTLEFYRHIFGRYNIERLEFIDSGEAFVRHYINEDNEPPDMVLLDISMPGMDGVEVLEHSLRSKKFDRTIIVAHTAFSFESDDRWLSDVGFDDVIHKPIQPDEFFRKIEDLLSTTDEILSRRNPYGKLFDAVKQLSSLRILHNKLEMEYINKLIAPQVYKILKKNEKTLRPKYQNIAVGFVDIREFTLLMNRLRLEQVDSILTLYFEHVTDCIDEYGGFLDKFIGDSVMWFFHGEEIDLISQYCIDVAVNIRRGMSKLNNEISKRLHHRVRLQVGMGIACGTGAVGIFGAPSTRFQYSILGTPVNLASRLCAEAGPSEILIGGSIIEYCQLSNVKCGYRTIKGFENQIEVRKLGKKRRS